MNSKDKGKRGELEAVRFLKALGYDVRRTAQYCGNTGDAADIEGMEGFHVEVKRVERLNVYDAVEQAVRDSHGKKIPFVMWRKNNKPWLIVQLAQDWVRVLEGDIPDDEMDH